MGVRKYIYYSQFLTWTGAGDVLTLLQLANIVWLCFTFRLHVHVMHNECRGPYISLWLGPNRVHSLCSWLSKSTLYHFNPEENHTSVTLIGQLEYLYQFIFGTGPINGLLLYMRGPPSNRKIIHHSQVAFYISRDVEL